MDVCVCMVLFILCYTIVWHTCVNTVILLLLVIHSCDLLAQRLHWFLNVKSEIGLQKESCLLGYNAVWTIGSQPAFWRNMSPSSWELLNESNKNTLWMQVANMHAYARACTHTILLIDSIVSQRALLIHLFIAWLILWPWICRHYVPSEVDMFFIGFRGINFYILHNICT
jgi:hypothetical protein